MPGDRLNSRCSMLLARFFHTSSLCAGAIPNNRTARSMGLQVKLARSTGLKVPGDTLWNLGRTARGAYCK